MTELPLRDAEVGLFRPLYFPGHPATKGKSGSACATENTDFIRRSLAEATGPEPQLR